MKLTDLLKESTNNIVKDIKQYLRKTGLRLHSQGRKNGKINLCFITDQNHDGENAGVEDVLKVNELKNELKNKFREIKDINISIDRRWVKLNIIL